MKKILPFLLLISGFIANASTSITTPTVSGHWTLAGSPYLVFNDIQVANTGSLVVDPGVSIIFQGSYRLFVYGILHASGTASQPINFTVNDTTGFSTDTITTAGGWHGIQFDNFGGTGADSSILNYCNITYTKFDSADGLSFFGTIGSHRSLAVHNCNIYNNTALNGGPNTCPIIGLVVGILHPVIYNLSGCSIHNNTSPNSILLGASDSITVSNCSFYLNTGKFTVIKIEVAALTFTNNDVYQNQITDYGGHGTLSLDIVSGSVKNNKFHDNINYNSGGLSAYNSIVDISGNLICNNQNTSSICGAVSGGGGIFLQGDATSFGTSFYNVNNNVIANNYSNCWGGGLCIQYTEASVTNNQIVKNSAPNGGGILFYKDTLSLIKNNIIYGNETSGSGIDAVEISNSYVEYSHNYSELPDYDLIYAFLGSITGDSTTNIHATSPDLIAPTLTASVTESALIANFRLMSTSPCINRGDTANIAPDTVDYDGNRRIIAGHIDIGAFELPGTLKMNQPASEYHISIFPNPAKDIFAVSTPNAKGSIELLDIKGAQAAMQQVISTTTAFDIHTLPRGIYFAVWNEGNGEKAVQKVVLE